MKEKKTQKKATNLVAMIVVPVLILLAVVTCLVARRLNVLPGNYFALMVIALAVLLMGILLLLYKYSGSVRGILGILLSVLVTAGMVFGMVEMNKVHKTMEKVTTVSEVKIVEVSMFVRMDDPAQKKKDTADYIIGILEEQDREASDLALKEIADKAEKTLSVMMFANPVEMFQSLLDGEIGAVLYNSALYTILMETIDQTMADEYAAGIRELSRMQVEMPVIKTAETGTNAEQQAENGKDKETDPKAQQKKDINKEEIETATGELNEAGLPEVITLYVTGIDTYGGIGTVSRSDVNILVSVNTRTHQVLLLSTPRDYFVPLTVSGGHLDKLTHAGIYGVDCSIGTMEMLYDVPIDYYFRVNFSGFQEIVDALGGVTIENEFAFTSRNCYFPAGEITLDGEHALAYVRDRYDFADGDFARGRNQMKVVKSILEKATSTDMLFNFNDLLTAIEGNFETDAPYDLIGDLVKYQLSENPQWNIVTTSAEGWCDMQVTWSIGWGASSVVIPYEESVEACKELLRQVRDGEVLKID